MFFVKLGPLSAAKKFHTNCKTGVVICAVYDMTYIPTAKNRISIFNVKTTPLTANTIYTGTGEDVSNYAEIKININTDQDSAPSGLSIEFSSNNSDWDKMHKITHRATDPGIYTLAVDSQYMRIQYINGETDQGHMRLQAMLKAYGTEVRGSVTTTSSYAGTDAFGRSRVSEPFTLFNITHTRDENSFLVAEKLTGGATATHLPSESSMQMDVSSNGDKVTRQSRRYPVYQPGKSLLIIQTGVLDSNSNGTDCISRIGYFDDNNGYWFQHRKGEGVSLYERSKVHGSVVDTQVLQTNWNIDKVNGTESPSNYYMDASKVQIFITDLQWLGVGEVRIAIDIGNNYLHYIHIFRHVNISTGAYITSANLPLRWEIESVGSTNPAGRMKMICGTAISEGGCSPEGQIFSSATGTTAVTIRAEEVPIIAIRAPSSNPHINIFPLSVSTMAINRNILFWRLRIWRAPSSDPIAGGTWSSAHIYGDVEHNTTGTAITEGTSVVVASGYISGKNKSGVENLLNNASKGSVILTADIDGAVDYLAITGIRVGPGNVETVATMDWEEVW